MDLGNAASGMVTAASATLSSGTVLAGFSGLPLRNCQATYCGELQKLPYRSHLLFWSMIARAGPL